MNQQLISDLSVYFPRLDTTPVAVRARVYNSTAIATATGVGLILTFDSVREDTNDLYDPAFPSRLTAPYDGFYAICLNLLFDASSGGTDREAAIIVNGSVIIAFGLGSLISASAACDISAYTMYTLNAGDYVEVLVTQDSGGALNIVAGSAYSPEFAMCRLA